jgi:ribonuclease BN (tRNA processing enzyme)
VSDLEAFMDSPTVWRNQPRFLVSSETMDLISPTLHSSLKDSRILVARGVRWEMGAFSMEFSQTDHQIPTLATCISSEGRRILYGADTGPTWVAPRHFTQVDLAILECTLDVRERSSSPYHLDAREVAVKAHELCARRVLVTHVPPRASGAARIAIARTIAPNQDFVLASPRLDLLL